MINFHDDMIHTVTETCDCFVDLRLVRIEFLFGDLKFEIPSCTTSLARQDVPCIALTGGRTDHSGETERRHEGGLGIVDSDSDSRDVGGEPRNQGRASGPGSDGVLAMAAVE